jgi:four helix bundle protein
MLNVDGEGGVLRENVILEKSFAFAVRVVKLSRYLRDEHQEYVLSKQLLRSGTSIGANVNEAQAAQTPKDFSAKMSIASKEARETKYWIDLLLHTDYLSPEDTHVKSLLADIDSLNKLLTSIVKTSQENLQNAQ